MGKFLVTEILVNESGKETNWFNNLSSKLKKKLSKIEA